MVLSELCQWQSGTASTALSVFPLYWGPWGRRAPNSWQVTGAQECSLQWADWVSLRWYMGQLGLPWAEPSWSTPFNWKAHRDGWNLDFSHSLWHSWASWGLKCFSLITNWGLDRGSLNKPQFTGNSARWLNSSFWQEPWHCADKGGCTSHFRRLWSQWHHSHRAVLPWRQQAGPAVLNSSYTLTEATWCRCQMLHQGNSTTYIYTSFTSEPLSSLFKRILSCLNQGCLLLYIVTEMGPSSQ